MKPDLTKETDIDMFSNLSNNFIWQPFEWFVYVWVLWTQPQICINFYWPKDPVLGLSCKADEKKSIDDLTKWNFQKREKKIKNRLSIIE